MTSLKFSSEAEEAVKDVRDDSTSTNWVALTYDEGSKENVGLLAKGEGDADELKEKTLTEDKVVYALVRVTEIIDQSTTIKFVFVNWVGEKTPRMLKARLGTHSGSIQSFLTPHHIEIKCDDLDEISAAIVEDRVGVTSGTKSHIVKSDGNATTESTAKPTTSTPAPAAAPAKPADTNNDAEKESAKDADAAPSKPVTTPKKAVTAKQTASVANANARSVVGVRVDDEDAVKNAIADVRDNDTDTNWAAASYVPGHKPWTLTLFGSGSGGIDELLGKLTEDNVYYILSRHNEKIDQTTAVKFAFTAYTGPKTPRMLVAQKGTHKGGIETLFRPYHVDLTTDDKEEITEQELLDRIKFASGTKSHVKN